MPTTSLAHRRMALLALVVGMLTLGLIMPTASLAFICEDGYPLYDTLYYSSASHKTLVGECIGSCTAGEHCTGKTSAYFVQAQVGCCSFN